MMLVVQNLVEVCIFCTDFQMIRTMLKATSC